MHERATTEEQFDEWSPLRMIPFGTFIDMADRCDVGKRKFWNAHYRPVADGQMICQPPGMQLIEQVGADWIAYAGFLSSASEQQEADAMSMLDLSRDEPELSWSVIKYVIRRYPESELNVDYHTEAKAVIGLVAAGPLEDLLREHGKSFIDRIEVDSSNDARMRWALRGIYTSHMSEEIRTRVDSAIGKVSG